MPIVVFLLSCGVSFLFLSSCRPGRDNIRGQFRHNISEGIPVIRVRLTATPVLSIKVEGTKTLQIETDTGQIAGLTNEISIKRNGGTWYLGDRIINSRVLTIKDDRPVTLTVKKRRSYRGSVLLLPNTESSDRFYVHNHISMENYLASVVACELYDSFQVETFKAQAVAARTYAMYEIATRGKNGSFDVWNSQQSQVYKGVQSETPNSRRAVSATCGWVLAYGPKGQERIFLTQFSASNGGYVNGADVLREVPDMIPPLRGGQSDADSSLCPKYAWKPVKVSMETIYRALTPSNPEIGNLGSITGIQVETSTSYGRPVWMRIIGERGRSAVIRAESIRLALRKQKVYLNSMNCKIRTSGNYLEFYDGKGLGHGVGMSQWGAEKKARDGSSCREILMFYYPEAGLFRAY